MSTLIKTDGIVLNHTLYRDNSAIIHVYTRELGRQDYVVNGVRGSRKNRKTALLQPLNRLSMEVYHAPDKDLHRIKEFSLLHPLKKIPYHQKTRAQAFFLTELLSKVLILQDPAARLYDFIDQAVEVLDSEIAGTENLHLFVMFHLADHMGFMPENNYSFQGMWFDLKNGCFVPSEPTHPMALKPEKAALFSRLFDMEIASLEYLARNVSERRDILEALLDYFRIHAHGFGNLRSLDVLHSMLRD
ncbi:MAG: DNA repair protein RecO [Marinilabiliaceae bacterium]